MQTSTPAPQYTPEVERITRPIYERIRHVIPAVEWPVHAPLIAAINDLKRERNAVILAHNYQTPEISYGVADFRGDSLALAQQGATTDTDVIVMCGVRFMAETAKIMSPEKTVLLPDIEAGCSLAASITGADVRRLKAQYPGVPVVCYVNAYADVRAEADICCTSSNAVKVVESLGTDRVIFIPGRLPRPLRRRQDQGRGHPLGRCLRGPRALHARRRSGSTGARSPASTSWPIPNARPKCCGRPTTSARPPA